LVLHHDIRDLTPIPAAPTTAIPVVLCPVYTDFRQR
jgi:hypothetical protein